MIWLLPMLSCVNGKKCFESANGITVSNQAWRRKVRESFAGWDKPCNLEKGHRARCRPCSDAINRDIRTRRICTRCGPICKLCHQNGRHATYARRLLRGALVIHRHYSIGQKVANDGKQARESVRSLVY